MQEGKRVTSTIGNVRSAARVAARPISGPLEDGLLGGPLCFQSSKLGEPRENGYSEAFKGKMRDELLDRKIFYTISEVQVLIERCSLDSHGQLVTLGLSE